MMPANNTDDTIEEEPNYNLTDVTIEEGTIANLTDVTIEEEPIENITNVTIEDEPLTFDDPLTFEGELAKSSTPCKKRAYNEIDDDLNVEQHYSVERFTSSRSVATIEAEKYPDNEIVEASTSTPLSGHGIFQTNPNPSTSVENVDIAKVTDSTSTPAAEKTSRQGTYNEKTPLTIVGRTFFLLDCHDAKLVKAIKDSGGYTVLFYDTKSVTDVVVKKTQNKGSCKVIDSALYNNIAVHKLSSLTKCLRQSKKTELKTSQICKLRPPFIKVEDRSKLYRPQIKEFNRFPSCLDSFKRKTVRNDTFVRSNKRNFYCEHCQEPNILDLQKHLETKRHKAITSKPGYWSRVDSLIQDKIQKQK